MKITLKITILLLSLWWPTLSIAAGFSYDSLYKIADDKLIIQSGALENKNYYLCSNTQVTCQNLGQETPNLTKLGLNSTENDDQQASLAKLKKKYKEIYNASRIEFSPTGRYLVYYISSKVNSDKIRHHVLIDLKNSSQPQRSETKSTVKNWDLLTEENRLFSFSPDESFFIYSDDHNGFPTLYQAKLPQTRKTLISKKLFTRNYSVGDFLLWDKNTLYFYANREKNIVWNLYRYRLDTGALQKIASDVSYGEKIYRSGDFLLFTRLVENRKIVSRYDPISNTSRDFSTQSIANNFSNLVRKETTLAGLQSVIVRTEKTPGKPLIIWLHGGPYRQIANTATYHPYQSYAVYDWLLDQMASNGAIVAKVDYVGSYGYGRKFADGIVGQVGKKDVTNITAITSELKTMYKPSAIYLVGNSYGGYLALRVLAEKPANYAGAISINGVTNWTKLLDHYQNSIFNTYFKGLRADDNDPLFLQSGIADKLDRVTNQKIMLVQNLADKTIPPVQASWLANILATRHKIYDYVTYEGEDHVFAQSKNIADLCQKIANFIKISSDCRW